MSFFPSFSTVDGEFSPLFRLLDDYASHQSSRASAPSSASTRLRTFQPRFDVKELKDTYELHGELPGVDQSNVSIEFTDAQTLTIKGRTERYSESGTPPNAIEAKPDQAKITSGESHHQFHKASVEDEAPTSSVQPDASESSNTAVAQTPKSEHQQVQKHHQQPAHKYWISERSIGEFQRTFQFPSRVDQENVKASLKNGILSVIVPKATAPALKKIQVES